MEEENVKNDDLGKFKSVDALKKAYEELEAEFTRRSQRLKALEQSKAEEVPQAGETPSPSAPAEPAEERGGEALYRAVMEDGAVRARVLSEYLDSLKGVPLLMGSGKHVPAPADRPRTFAEAGDLALGYFKSKQKGE